jgi:hypothetical protein
VWLAWCRFSGENVLINRPMKKLIEESSNDLSKIFRYNPSTKKVEYIWMQLSSDQVVCEPISVADTLLRVLIEWIVWMNEGWNEWNTKFWALGNTSDTKMQYFGTKTVSNATLMNYAIKKAELLCRWKWDNNPNISRNTILCYQNAPHNDLELSQLNWKTVVVKEWNVTVKPFTGGDKGKNYDIYLLSGNLIIDENNATGFVFTTGWFITNTSIEAFSGAVDTALCPNGHGEGKICDWRYSGSGAAVWVFLRWNFIVNGVVQWKGGDLKNKYFIYGKFTTNDSFNSLESTFSWTCENWLGKDGNYCAQAHDGWYNPYRNAALVVIDQNYGSPLLE